jgi:hypothetical protein
MVAEWSLLEKDLESVFSFKKFFFCFDIPDSFRNMSNYCFYCRNILNFFPSGTSIEILPKTFFSLEKPLTKMEPMLRSCSIFLYRLGGTFFASKAKSPPLKYSSLPLEKSRLFNFRSSKLKQMSLKF